MVPPQTEGEYFNTPLPMGLGEGVEKHPIIFFAKERRLPGRAPVYHVINRAFILNPQWSGHAKFTYQKQVTAGRVEDWRGIS
jgi:hypothetical protein